MREVKWALRGMAVVGIMGIWVVFGQGELLGAPAMEPAASARAEGVASGKAAEEPASQTKEAEKPTPPETPQVSPPTVAPEELDKLVQQLDADSFAERQSASQRLAELGRAAIEALIRAATSESLEANVRALDILKRHLDSPDAELKKASLGALEKIAGGARAPSARRAKDILKTHEEREKLQQQMPQQIAGIGPARVVAQAHMIGGQGERRVQVVDGVKTIEGEEKDLKFRIVEDPKEGITVELTRKKEGKEVTEKFQAKNAEELQKKHPEAYEVYKRHSQPGGVIMQAGPIGIGRVQIAPAQPVPAQRVPAQVVRRHNLELASRQLPLWINMVERLVTEEAIKESSRESLEDLKKKCEEARQALEKIERRLQEAIEQKAKEEKPKEEQKGKEEQPQEKPSPSQEQS